MKNQAVVRKELQSLLGTKINLGLYSLDNQKTKIVSVASNEDGSFFIAVLPVHKSDKDLTVSEGNVDMDWSKSLEGYSDTKAFWIDNEMVEDIKDLEYLKIKLDL